MAGSKLGWHGDVMRYIGRRSCLLQVEQSGVVGHVVLKNASCGRIGIGRVQLLWA